MALQKPSLLKQFKDIIDANIEKGAKTSKELRKGIPSSFTDADGIEYRLQNVGRYARTGKNPTFLDVAKNKEVTASRANAIKMQTSPNVEKFNPKTDAVKGTEAHHKRMVKMYAPFYDGLDENQAKELTQWFVDEGVPLGDAKANLKNLTPKVHKEIHNWMQENNIQVSPDKTGKGNFVTQTKGKNKGKLLVKGSAESGVKAVMPSFKDFPLNARFAAITDWIKYVQDPIDSKLAELEWDDYRRLHPPKPTDKLQVSAIARELAEEGKINKGLKIGKKLKWMLPAVGGASALLSGVDAKARHQKAEETGNWVDKLQSGIAKAEFAADTVGAVPGPHSIVAEPVGLGAGLSNLTIDAIRGFKPNKKMTKEERKKAIERLKIMK